VTGPQPWPGGRLAHVKQAPASPGLCQSEALGLAWLSEPGAVPVPEVLHADEGSIAVAWIDHGLPTAEGADTLGRGLADLHAAGAPSFGAPWPGFIGPLAMDNGPLASAPGWSAFYAERRVLPFLRLARDRGAVDTAGVSAVERVLGRLDDLCGASAHEPPSRIHGDLWSGNVVWDTTGTAWLIDPAAHGGHRETDLAMLALFGAPHLDRILAAYHARRPLADGWSERVALHQLHPLLVHAVLFGGGYGGRAVAAARRYAGR
jgi:fructosamine-3-kinase